MKVTVVTNLPRPYRHALFNEVARQLGGKSGLTVVYCAEASRDPRRRYVDHPFEGAIYSAVQLRSFGLPTRGERSWSLARGLPGLLERIRPDVLVAGGFGPDALVGHAACRALGVPTAVWSGAWVGGECSSPRLQQAVRRFVSARTSAFIAYGSLARDYLISVGADPRRVAVAVNTVDLERFAEAGRDEAGAGSELRGRFGLAERNVLCVGTLTESKGLRELVRAFRLVDTGERECALHVAGTGPLAGELLRLAGTLGSGKALRMHGFLQEPDIVRLMGACDVCVCPSLRELWGLVINEAMACGLPVIASRLAGATRDLLDDGVNGFVVDPTRPEEIAGKLGLLLADSGLAREMGRRAASSIRERASLERSAEGFIRGIQIALANGPRSRGFRRVRSAGR